MYRAVRAFILLGSIFLGAVSPSTAAGTAELLHDINSVEDPDGEGYGVAGPLVPAGNRVVFPAYTPGSGFELWVSDGTSLGTEQLREAFPDIGLRLVPIGTVRGTAIFLVESDSGGEIQALWRSDGNPDGTFQIAQAASCSSRSQSIVVGSFLFFTARAVNGCSVWKTDGTAAGTSLVKGIEPGSWDVGELAAAGGRLFFFVGPELWISDGTPAGTILLRSFEERADDGLPELTPAGSRVFFFAPVPGSGDEELWTSDGTPAGTRPVTSFFEPFPFAGPPYESIVTAIDSVLYFLAYDGTGVDLWQSDGTLPGTRRVTDFVEPHPFPRDIEPIPFLTRLGNRLIFAAGDDRTGWRLWTSEGTPDTTAPLAGCPGGCPKVFLTSLVRIGNRAVFAGSGGSGGGDLWVTDGTGSGTRRLAANLCDDSCSAFGINIPALFSFQGKVFFIAQSSQGFALWRTDGTLAGTIRLADLSSDLSPNPFSIFSGFAPVQAGGKIFFAADPGRRGLQLWSSDGTPAGTGLVTLIAGTPGSSPSGLVPFGGGVLFGACDGETVSVWRSDGTGASPLHPPGEGDRCPRLDPLRPVVAGGIAFYLLTRIPFSGDPQLWRSDGTAAGTFPLFPGGSDSIHEVVAFGDQAVFFVNSDNPGPEPPFTQTSFWTSDGTVAGTHPLAPLPFGPRSLTVLGSRLFFLAYGPDSGEQLWVSDGTAAAPTALTDLDQNAFDPHVPLEIAQVGSSYYFRAQSRLWKTDGTAAGTFAVPFPPSTIPFALEGYWPSGLVAFQGALYFMAGTTQSPAGRVLWRSDGTAAGTFVVKPAGTVLNAVPEHAWLTVLGDRLFFAADDGEHGVELWTSDGTAAGTVMVRDIAPGEASSRPSWLTVAGGRLYFAASDGSSGVELWESDGTAAGTRRVQDIAPGAESSNPRNLTVSGSRLFFAADDGVHGEEPWVLSLAGGGCVPSADALCLGGRFRVEAGWRDFQGNRGMGHAVALTADTGYFWFFDAANVEVILKVLDGRGLNDHHWVFYGALSNVEYSLTVTDTQTGAVRRYINPPGRLGSVADTEAFGPRGAKAAGVVTLGPAPRAAGEPVTLLRTAPATESCTPGATRLCLQDGRFAVEARWKAQGQTGTGKAIPLAGGDTGYFWFFDAGNVEVVLKVLDGRPLNGKFWVFYGALSDVEYTLTVTDTVTGKVKTYTNPGGRLASVADTGAF